MRHHQRQLAFLSTSAKTGDNVEEAFVSLARRILQAEQGRTSVGGTQSHRLHVSCFLRGKNMQVRTVNIIFSEARR